MVGRAVLTLGRAGRLAATDGIPVTWLALFEPADYVAQIRSQDDELFEVCVYRTSPAAARARAIAVVARLRERTAAWAYLRPLDLLAGELELAGPGDAVELDATELTAGDQAFRQIVASAAGRFSGLMDSLDGQPAHDLGALRDLMSALSRVPAGPLERLSAPELVAWLVGRYAGDPGRAPLYAPDRLFARD